MELPCTLGGATGAERWLGLPFPRWGAGELAECHLVAASYAHNRWIPDVTHRRAISRVPLPGTGTIAGEDPRRMHSFLPPPGTRTGCGSRPEPRFASGALSVGVLSVERLGKGGGAR